MTSPAGLTIPTEQPSLDLHRESTSPFQLVRAVWRKRDLLVLLARKEFHVRYRRASFGMLWAVILPLIQSAVMAVVFTRIVRIHTAAHYPVFMLTGMIGWTYFQVVFGSGATAIVDGSDLSSRIYFPRALLPMVSAGTNLYGMVIMAAIVIPIAAIFGAPVGPHILFLVPAMMMMVALCVSLNLVFSAINVYFRDMRYVVQASLLVLMYVSPVIYPPGLAPHALRTILAVNPLTGIIDVFHVSSVGAGGPMAIAVTVSLVWIAALLTIGLFLQARFDRVFADLL
ncbi:MAG: ABC transporter permease [Acidimicrobiales bacterium]